MLEGLVNWFKTHLLREDEPVPVPVQNEVDRTYKLIDQVRSEIAEDRKLLAAEARRRPDMAAELRRARSSIYEDRP